MGKNLLQIIVITLTVCTIFVIGVMLVKFNSPERITIDGKELLMHVFIACLVLFFAWLSFYSPHSIKRFSYFGRQIFGFLSVMPLIVLGFGLTKLFPSGDIIKNFPVLRLIGLTVPFLISVPPFLLYIFAKKLNNDAIRGIFIGFIFSLFVSIALFVVVLAALFIA